MSANKPQLTRVFVEVLLIIGAMGLVPTLARRDHHFYVERVSEQSATEILQVACLVICALAYWGSGMRNPQWRAWLTLVTGFFVMLLVRELDFYFDLITHGSWTYAASAVFIASLWLAYRDRASLADGMRRFFSDYSYAYVLVGMLFVIVFSRLFGSSSFLVDILGEHYRDNYKNLFQESLELFGYLVATLGAVQFRINTSKPGAGNPTLATD